MWDSSESDAARVYRLMRENPAFRSGNALMKKFSASAQPAVCLAAAVLGYFELELPEQDRGVLEVYLRNRIRPCCELLIELNLVKALRETADRGWQDAALTEQLLGTAIRLRRTESVVWLLQQKSRVTGFPDRDFSL